TAVSGELVSLAATERDDHVIAAGWAADSFFWQHVPLQEGRVPRAGERKVALLGVEFPTPRTGNLQQGTGRPRRQAANCIFNDARS
ncbi:MAG: hypothetical protein WBW08_07645, partial [Methyloceanibacter sp.]